MKNWKFIKVGNSKSYRYKGFLIQKDDFGGWTAYLSDGLHVAYKSSREDMVKDWADWHDPKTNEVIKVGNKDTAELREKLRDIDELIKNWEHAKSINGMDEKKAQKIIDGLRKEKSQIQREIATGNESIDKQEWSMFKGLTKKAEEEVGNETYQHKLYPDKYVIIDGNNYKIITDGKVEKSGELTDAVLYGINQTYKRVSSMNSKTGNKAIYDDSGRFIIGYVEKNGNGYSAYTHGITGSKSYLLDAKDEKTAEAELKDYVKAYEKRTGNSDTVSEYNAEINRLTKKAEQLRRMGQGKSAMEIEKQIEKLGKELREIGNSKYGSKEDIISHLDTDLYDIHKNMGGKDRPIFFYVSELQKKGYDIGTISKFIKDIGKTVERLKTGNETLGQWAKAKPRIINETKAERKFGKVMGEFEEGALKTPQGKTVTDPAQAKAIAYSEADKVDNLKRARNAMKNKK